MLRDPPPSHVELRGATIAAAPFALVGFAGAVMALVVALWMASGGTPGAVSWAAVAAGALLAVAALWAVRGCRVVVRDGVVEDRVAGRLVHRVRQSDLVGVRVRRGPWRTFEIEAADGSRRVLLGAGPQQFPASLTDQARERDLAEIDLLLGPDQRPT